MLCLFLGNFKENLFGFIVSHGFFEAESLKYVEERLLGILLKSYK